MNSKITSKKNISQAGGFIALLVVSAFPLSILGIQMLNFILGNIQV